MSQEQTFITAVDTPGVVKNALFIIAGIAVVVIGALGLITLKFGSLVLPSWSMYILGALFIGIGAILVYGSLKQEKCGKCHTNSEFEELHFHPDMEMPLLEAVEQFDFTHLKPHFVEETAKNVTLNFRYCPSCHKSAEVMVENTAMYQANTKELLKTTLVPSEKIPAMVNFVETYAVSNE